MQDNFSEQARTYAQYRPTYPQELYDFILALLEKKSAAWDCATGSGQVARRLADYFERVYASDISSEQMSFAPQKSNITYLNAPAENTPFPDDAFDLITVAQAVHWFNIDDFYAEVRRTAKNGALLAVIGYGMVRVNKVLNPIINQFYDDAFTNYFTENRSYLDHHYSTIPFPFKEIESPDFNASYEWSISDLEGYFNSWSAVQKIKDEEGYNPVPGVIAEIEEYWDKDEIKEVRFPIFMRLGQINS